MQLPHNLILWPFKKLDNWLRARYQSKQIQEQTDILRKQLLLETIPDLVVSVNLTRNNLPPRRSDLAYVDVSVKNYGGKTEITEGRFWISVSNNPTYDQEKNLSNVEMPKSKEENFFFILKSVPEQEVVSGKSILKCEYQICFKGANGHPEEKKRRYEYNRQKQKFIPNAQEQ
jgi:hypothetical protein